MKTIIELGNPGDAIQSIKRTVDPLAEFSDAEIRETLGHEKGEPMTGYEAAELKMADGITRNLGDFTCENCFHFSSFGHECDEKHMITYSKNKRSEDGCVIVDSKGCCGQIERMGMYFQGKRREK